MPSSRPFGSYLGVLFTYLFDNGLRKCLAHGDGISRSNLVRARLPVGEGLNLRDWAEQREMVRHKVIFSTVATLGMTFSRTGLKSRSWLEKKIGGHPVFKVRVFRPCRTEVLGSPSLAGCTE